MSLDQILMLPPGYGFDATAALTPESVATLVAWGDANYRVYSDAGTTLAMAEEPVYEVHCHVGSETIVLRQATLGNRPILKVGANGKRYFDFNGTSHRLVATSTSVGNLTGDFTILVMANVTATGDRFLLSKQKSTAQYNGYGLSEGSAGNKLFAEVSDGTYTSKASTTAVGAAGGWRNYGMKRSTTTATLYHSGAADGSGTVQGGDISFAIGLTLGAFAGGSAFLQGGVTEFAIYSSALSDANRGITETCFTANIPT